MLWCKESPAGAAIYFVDEAGIRSNYHSGTTWAPVGRTPVVPNTGARFSINMLSAVSTQGALRFLDGHPAHRAKATTTFVAATDGRLTLVFLPGYSPELNPDEWVWKNVTHDRIGKTDVTSRHDLKTKAIGALRRPQKSPHFTA